MCGKFSQLASWEDVVAFSEPLTAAPADAPLVIATPMRFARVMHRAPEGVRALTPMRWGFPDRNAKNPARPRHMHARAETVDTLPTFAPAFANGRGVLMVHTFNEGEELPNGKTKQWTITPRDARPIAIAVLFETWENGAEQLLVFVQVTVPASPLIAPVTDRMPAILQAADIPVWLGETAAAPGEIKALLRTHDDAGAWSIAPEVKAKPAGGGQASLF